MDSKKFSEDGKDICADMVSKNKDDYLTSKVSAEVSGIVDKISGLSEAIAGVATAVANEKARLEKIEQDKLSIN